jgi:hypothetical protein
MTTEVLMYSGTVDADSVPTDGVVSAGEVFTGTMTFNSLAPTTSVSDGGLTTPIMSSVLTIGAISANSTTGEIWRVSDLVPSDEDYYYFESGPPSSPKFIGLDSISSFEITYQKPHIASFSTDLITTTQQMQALSPGWQLTLSLTLPNGNSETIYGTLTSFAVTPVNFTWLGGGNNSFTNPKDWSPNGVPAQGDSLFMNSGTMNINGYQLPLGTNMVTSGKEALNLSDGASFSTYVNGTAAISLTGTDTLLVSASGGGNATVHIANGGEMIGTFGVGGGNASSLTIEGNGVFDNGFARDNGGYSYTQNVSDVVVNAKVIGTGIFNDYGGTMEFMKSVGSGQSVNVLSWNGVSLLNLDDPTEFAGQVDLSRGAIDLVGLGKVGSFTFANAILSLYVGNKVVDTLRLTNDTAKGFGVERSGNNLVTVYSVGDNPVSHAAALPMHV